MLLASAQNRTEIDSLVNRLQTHHSKQVRGSYSYQQDTATVLLLNKLAFAERNTNPDSALHYAEHALRISQGLDYGYGIGLSTIRIATVYQKKGQYDRGVNALLAAMPMMRQLNDPELLGKAWLNLGVIYKKKGDYPSAVDAYLTSLKHYKLSEDRAKGLNNLAIVYSLNRDFAQAIVYYKHALKLQTDLGDAQQMAMTCLNLALVNSEKGALDSARLYLDKCLDLELQSPNPRRRAMIWMQLGYLEEEREQYKEAESFYLQALAVFETLEAESEIVYCLNNLGVVYSKMKRNDLAINHYNKSLERARAIGLDELEKDIYFNLYALFQDQSDWKQALHYLKLHKALKDTLFNEAKNEQIASLTTQYETEKKEQAIVQLQQEQELNDIKLAQQRDGILWRNTILVGAAALLLLGGLLLFNYRQKARNVALLAQKDKELHEQETFRLLKQQELEQFEAMMALQADERHRIANDLHDRLGNDLATVKLFFDSLQDKVGTADHEYKDQYRMANELLAEACEKARKIAHSMSSGLLAESGLLTALREMATVVEASGKLKINVLATGMDQRLDETTEIRIYRAIQEMVTNIIRHADASEASIQLTRHEQSINIVVEDDGKGFVHRPGQTASGMGLRNMAARIEEMGGELLIDSGKGRGTTIIANIPLDQLMAVRASSDQMAASKTSTS